MKYRTTRFGEIEFPEEVVINFSEGILGFPQDRRYILLEHDAEGSPFQWLQSLDNPDLAFIIIEPHQVEARYQYDIDRDTERLIGTGDPSQCAVMCIVNVPHGNPVRMTANLKAPLVVNVESRCGRQVVLGSQAYAISTPVFPDLFAAHDESSLPERAVS
jgi:flagellar assembly factor FliW